jgi:hypothetical protein
MKRLMHAARILVLATLGATAVAPVQAHPGPGEAVPREEAVRRADSQISRLVESGKLEKSWVLGAKLQSADLRAMGGGKEWVLTFSNASATEADKKLLYVFLSETGEYLAANFTGK